MATFNLEIVTPQRLVYRGEVTGVRAPGIQGGVGVLARHIPYLTALTVGEIIIREEGDSKYLATSGGFVEILRSGVVVLAENAEFAEEIDTERAEQARERAKERARQRSAEIDQARAEAALARAINRLRISQRL